MRGYLWTGLLALLFVLTACTPQARLAGCNAVLVSATEAVTAAHCVVPYGVSQIRVASGQRVRVTEFAVDAERDTAHLVLAQPVWAMYYATYREPSPGTFGVVYGGCPFREQTMFRVVATGPVSVMIGGRFFPLVEWQIRDGQVSCPGDSGSPVWSASEGGVYYGVVSRYAPLRTALAGQVSVWELGTTVYSAGK